MPESNNGEMPASVFERDLEELRSQLSSLATGDPNRLLAAGPMIAEMSVGIVDRLIEAFPNLKQDWTPQDVDRMVAEMRDRRRTRVTFHGDPVFADVAAGSEVDPTEAAVLSLLEIRDHVEEGVSQLTRIAFVLEKVTQRDN